MGSRGPTPAAAPQRRNNPAKQLGGQGSPGVKAPALVGTYLPQTLAWYLAWTVSDNASQFSALDWQRLAFVAELVEGFFATDDMNLKLRLMAEIRQNESKLGATAEDRQRLRWKSKAPDAPEDGKKPSPSRARTDPRK